MLLGLIVALIYIFMLAPITVVVIEAFNRAELMQFPPARWSLRWFTALIEQQDFVQSFFVSLKLARLAALLSTAIGTAAAYATVRLARPRQAALETVLLAPLYVPRMPDRHVAAAGPIASP